MSDITFNCPLCDGHLIASADAAGVSVACPHCGKPMQIPIFTKTEAARNNPPSESQLKYLRDLGVHFNEATLTRRDASSLLDAAQYKTWSNQPPTEKQIAMAKRLGLGASLGPNISKQEISEMLDRVTAQPATSEQIERARSLGLTLDKRSEFTVGDLDGFIKLADRHPTSDDLASLGRIHIISFEGNALDARMILALQMIFFTEFSGMDDDDLAVAKACIIAARDDEFSYVTISSGSDFRPDWEMIRWPKAKLKKWWKAGCMA